MKRVPFQAQLPFGRKERVVNRQIAQRAAGVRVGRGPGRPRKVRASGDGREVHTERPILREKTAVHVTLKVRGHVPNLRARRRFAVVKAAFRKFGADAVAGFRLVHFAVLSNHLHFVVEVDSKKALSVGMQKIGHSISRRLNALSVREHGSAIRLDGRRYSDVAGWLGRVFRDRYNAHVLSSPTEMQRALSYLLHNAEHHYGSRVGKADPFTSFADGAGRPLARARGFSLARACRSLAPPT